MKKRALLCAVLLGVMLCALLCMTSCLETHEHAYDTTQWQYNDTHHYYGCVACESTINVQEHDFDDGKCSICGFVREQEETLLPDGSLQIIYFNENGDRDSLVIYDADGALISERIYLYDEDGALLGSTETTADADGYSHYREYNRYGHAVLSIRYSDDGTELSRLTADRLYDEDGNLLSYTVAAKYSDGCTGVGEGDAYDRLISFTEYDENGEQTLQDFYSYPEGSTERDPCVTDTFYADGTHITSATDAMGNRTALLFYDAEGNELMHIVWENSYDEEGTYLGCTMYSYNPDGSYMVAVLDENDSAVVVSFYSADGTLLYDIHYDEDGNIYATATYDEFENCIERIEYEDGEIFCTSVYEYTYLDETGELFTYTATHAYTLGFTHYQEFDIYNNETFSVLYADDGEVIVERTMSYVYDEDGNILEKTEFYEGNPFVITGYLPLEDGTSAMIYLEYTEYYYLQMGVENAFSYQFFDDYGNLIEQYMEIDGIAQEDIFCENEYDEDGLLLHTIQYEHGVPTYERTYTYEPIFNEYGRLTEDSTRTEQEVNLVTGAVSIRFYVYITDDWNGSTFLLLDETVNEADGSYYCVSYDMYGYVDYAEYYDANGVLRYEAYYDENEEWIEIYYDEDGNVIED